MTTVALILVFLYLTPVFRSYYRQFTTQRYGTETEAYVTCIDETVAYARGQKCVWRNCYVRFLKDDGQIAEAKLINPKKNLFRGNKVRIRYIPGKTDCAVLTGISDTITGDIGL